MKSQLRYIDFIASLTVYVITNFDKKIELIIDISVESIVRKILLKKLD